MEPSKKTPDKDLPEKEHEGNYNERPDGYGFAGAESENVEHPYEKEREDKKNTQGESGTLDENGMPNQQGEVDQYSFRDNH